MEVKYLISSYDEIRLLIEDFKDKVIPVETAEEILREIEIIRGLLNRLEEIVRGVYIFPHILPEEEIRIERRKEYVAKYTIKAELLEILEEIKRYIDKKIYEIK